MLAHRRADLNGDGGTGAADLLILNADWGNVGEDDSNRPFIRVCADLLPGRTVTNARTFGIEVLWPPKARIAAAPFTA
jgi:hypothetical protein